MSNQVNRRSAIWADLKNAGVIARKKRGGGYHPRTKLELGSATPNFWNGGTAGHSPVASFSFFYVTTPSRTSNSWARVWVEELT